MRIAYILTMPRNAAWDGKWSGDGNTNCIVREVDDAVAGRIANRRFTHGFGDGWVAAVAVRLARDTDKDTQFHGYEWMIDSINRHDKIRA